MKDFFKNYFTFNRSERVGILVLSSLIVVLLLIYVSLPLLIKQPSLDKSKWEEFSAKLESVNAIRNNSELNNTFELTENISEHTSKEFQLFDFNPNSVSLSDLLRLGFSNKLAKTLLNFRNAGGKFKKSDDLKKLYGMNEVYYEKIKPYIKLDSTASNENPGKDFYKSNKVSLVNLNTADSSELVKLEGIGPVFAKRIINFRKKLGGFYSTDQLKEVYGLDSSKFEHIKSKVFLTSDSFSKINLNTIDNEVLANHPYIGKKLAKLILEFRNQHGAYKAVDDIKKIPLITPQLYVKIAPYLTIN